MSPLCSTYKACGNHQMSCAMLLPEDLHVNDNVVLLGTFTEWRGVKGFMHRNHLHRQEDTYEFDDIALAVKENKNHL